MKPGETAKESNPHKNERGNVKETKLWGRRKGRLKANRGKRVHQER